ncbi:CHAP domain-containing protein [Arsenicicoccus dermatophilus]|uniref:CHAP domain-containing protein n=1 Tax=Arsenicicoccus dermatophilus TaxID=1076331 RepID=UPI003917452F
MTHVGRRDLLALTAGALVLGGCSRLPGVHPAAPTPPPFPDLSRATLTPHQRKVLDVLRAEYAAQPPPSRYTPVQGEPWCADFVSWVERASGAALRNPHGGGWRIPGTMTLLEHLRDTRAWHPAGSGYVPVAGDIAIYDHGGSFSQHTNYVLGLAGGVLTTIGGNEGGRSIRLSSHPFDERLVCLGFGHRG